MFIFICVSLSLVKDKLHMHVTPAEEVTNLVLLFACTSS